jgi:diguanylate cyclase (GGDEF)-like protein/PAS domain S-box-containing protein
LLEQLRMLLDRSDDLCGIVDRDGRYHWVNPAYAEAYGVTPEELRGQFAGDVIGQAYFERCVRPHLEEALAGRVQRYETTRDLVSGPSRRLLARYYPVGLEGQSAERIGFVITDISRVRQAEYRLADQARLIEIAGRVARIGGWSVDLVQGTMEWSDVTAEIHAKPPGHSPSIESGINFYAPEYRDRIRQLFSACAESGQPYDEELQIIDAKGRRRWVRAIGEAVRDEENRIVKVQGAFQDITAGMRERLEKQQLSERLSNLIESIDEGFVELDEDWRYTFVNRAAESISGKSGGELLGTTVWEQFPIEGAPIEQALRQAMEERRPGSAEIFFEPMGRWFDIRAYPWAPGIAIFFRDVSDHYKLVAELRRQEAALRKAGDKLGVELETRRRLINSLPAHIAMLDREGIIVDINDQWRHFGESGGSSDPAFGVGRSYIAVCEAATGECADEARQVANGVRGLLAGETDRFSLEYPCHSPDHQQWFRAVFNSLCDRDGVLIGMVAMHFDVTERKLAELEFRKIAFEDPLTGCLTRIGFVRRLGAQLKNRGWVSHAIVVILDITGMRDVNHTHGYELGDRLLMALSERLGEQAGPDDLIARLAGDEFAVYLSGGSGNSVGEQLRRMMAHINDGFDVPGNGGSIEIDFSAGYTVLGDRPRSAEALIQEAELAQYENRSRERSHEPWVGYSPNLRQRAREYSQLTAELREALRSETFELHFQPKVDLRNGRLIAAEALIRWRHPERGLQPPGIFIPVAERSQLIGPIGNWVLRTACRHLRDWKAEGLDLVRVSVNVSLVQFLVGDFIAEVERALKDFAVAPESLSLEITESVFERHSDRLISTMKRLHEIGVQLSLDDFGTGYSSLRYLQQYPFDEVKIDQSFTAGILTDEFSRNIVRSVMNIADAMHAKTVAEGIESPEAAELLLQMGCDIGQGFYYSMPLEAEDFRWLLQTGNHLPLRPGLPEESP